MNASAAPWLAHFAITRTVPVIARSRLPFPHGAYAALVAVSPAFALKVVPETRGVELEAMPG